MEPTRGKIFLLVFTIQCIHATINDGRAFERPEQTLINVLTKPLIFDEEIVSNECWRDSEVYREGLRNYEPWALQMYDSSVKIPSGIITGNYKQFGNYDECLRVKNIHGFVGKACSVTISFEILSGNRRSYDDKDISDMLAAVALASGIRNWTSGVTVPYQWLWCVPSSCDSEAVFYALETALSPLRQGGEIDLLINITNADCHTEHSNRSVFFLVDWLYMYKQKHI